MKKIISLSLVVVMIFSLGIVGLAADNQDMEKALVQVKSRVTIPENLSKFNYEISNENDGTTYNFNWATEDSVVEREEIRVSYTNGFISQYSDYKYNDYSQQDKKYSKVSKQEAIKLANDYIKTLNPDFADKIKITETENYNQNTYDFTLNRVENNIPFYYNNGNIRIDANTGELKYFYLYNWSFNVTFEKVENPISANDAQKAFGDKVGLKTVYNIYYDDTSKPYAKLCYVIDSDKSMMIDAGTGEAFSDQNISGPVYPMYDSMMKSSTAVGGAGGPALTQQEIDALTKNKELLTKEQAESAVRGMEIVGLNDNMQLTNAYLRESYYNKGEFEWQLSFTSKQTDNTIPQEKLKLMIAAGDTVPPSSWSYVTIDAKTKDLISFSGQGYAGKEEKAKYTQEQSEKIAKDVFDKYFANRLKDYKYVPSTVEYAKDSTNFNFSFVRNVNGISVPNNTCNISVCAIDGSVTNINSSFTNIEFPAANNILSEQDALTNMFGNVKFELTYVPVFDDASQQKDYVYKGYIQPKSTRLAYKIIDGSVVIDAAKGGLLDYNGKPLSAKKDVNYTDIEGHYAEAAIKRLAQINVLPNTDKFNPDQEVTQLDCLVLLSSLFNGYSRYDGFINIDDGRAVEQFYAQLKYSNIVKEGEAAPASAVTREDAIKYVIRFLGIDEYASLKTIYVSPFSDVTADTTDYVGHIAIAAGMKLVSGNPDGTFSPKENMTRAQIAIILDNYMNR